MNIITRIRKSYFTKGLAALLAFNMLGEIVWPTTAMALTSGPSQPEMQSFEPVETTDMVNLFTGDFTYNIPLLHVPGPNGGYPINLAYHASPGMDQEASWVGLGWNINAGAINRMVRGLPDDFNGDVVKEKTSIKDNWTVGLGVSPCLEIFGADNCMGSNEFGGALNFGLNFRYNSYKGFGYSLDPSLALSGSDINYNVGLSIDSEDGVGINANIGIKKEVTGREGSAAEGQKFKVTNYYGIGFNSRSGLDYSMNKSVSRVMHMHTQYKIENNEVIQVEREEMSYETWEQDEWSGSPMYNEAFFRKASQSVFSSSGLSFTEGNHYPSTSLPLNSYRLNVSFGTGISLWGVFGKTTFSGNYDVQRLKNKGKTVESQAYGYENMYDNPGAKYAQSDFSRTNNGDIRKTSSNLAIPQLTHDIYAIQGQGIGGSFRPYRTETGRIYDPNVVSIVGGGRYNQEIGIDHPGWGGGATVGYSEQQAWDRKNEDNDKVFSRTDLLWEQEEFNLLLQKLNTDYPDTEDYNDALKYLWDNGFKQMYYFIKGKGSIPPLPTVDDYKTKEDVYYKVHGEKATMALNEFDYIGGTEPIAGEITGNAVTSNYGVELDAGINPNRTNENQRIARNNLVHKLTNQEITDYYAGGSGSGPKIDYLGEFDINYYTWSAGGVDNSIAPNNALDRYTRNGESIAHHNAGYKVLDNSGSYYVYALPVYNNKKIEKVFSINAALPAKYAADGSVEVGSPKVYENKTAIVPMSTVEEGGVEDVDYKQSNTHKFYNSKETPAYAYSYLLTSILGADYVDMDGNGPSDGDRGFWVKMDYVKYADDYKWRAPYQGCMYSMGNPATLEDDKGSYQYGEKELWYMSRIETETHIAIFELEDDRTDNLEAGGEFVHRYDTESALKSGDPEGSRHGLRLAKIHLYEKDEYLADAVNAVPIQTVHFQYDYSRCQGVQNSSADEGKMTLTKVWFTYEGNSRGAMNPYVFTYSETNPSYEFERYDRWGNYKGDVSNNPAYESSEVNQILPYVNQYAQGVWGKETDGSEILLDNAEILAFEEQRDADASAWCLTEIQLPSGGTIEVDYESDDYAYVQNERATQMSYITRVNDNTDDKNQLYKSGNNQNDFDTKGEQRRIYFKLEKPIPVGDTEDDLRDRIYHDYVEGIKQDEMGKRHLYFRTYLSLKSEANDFVSGYLPLEENGNVESKNATDETILIPAYGASGIASVDGTDHYTEGFVTVECAKKKNGDCYQDYHPIAMAAWQYIRSSVPQILMDAGDDFGSEELVKEGKKKDKAKKVKNLFSFIPELIKMFRGYRKHCFKKGLAKFMELDKSMIRLTTPDLKKYGGGSRVKQIALTDNWDDFGPGEAEEVYGLVYDYTKTETIGGEEVAISSGVAQYEPMIGGDEIALRYPKFYPGKIPFFTDNNLFFEHPVNEAYMPAPIVGYSQVTVKSLNTAEQLRKAELGSLSAAELGRSTGGVQVYEFYTAKDFPVSFKETKLGTENKTIKNWNVPLLIPFIATYKRNKIAATQGYQIELNDMHGKLKSVANYGIRNNTEETYGVKDDPISKTTYNYKYQETSRRGEKSLVNTVKTVSKDPSTGEYVLADKQVGMEYEFFTDQRHSKNAVTTFSFNANIDAVTIPAVGKIPIPGFWSTVNSTKSDVRTYVTNKVIHRSGILEEVESQNEGYISTVRNVLYDAISGRPLLTEATNEFKDKVYNLSHPAHWEYEGMGHAYKNINMEFKADLYRISVVDTEGDEYNLYKGNVPVEVIDQLVPGDELIAHIKNSAEPESDYFNRKATFISKNYGGESENAVFYISGRPATIPDNIEGFFKVYRSGRRNHYMTGAGSVVAMVDPTLEANYTTETKSYDPITGDDELIPAEGALTMEIRKLSSNVLSVGAIVFKDNWEVEAGGNENPYGIGQAGIWRAYKNYVYAGERTQTLDGGAKSPRVREDGVMNNVPMFNWQVADYERFHDDWQWSGEVTRLNKFGYETENKDRLGIYSAALYGYEHALVMGVGGNAAYPELGTQDFEMFTDGTILRTQATVREEEGNMYFHSEYDVSGNLRAVAHADKHKILSGAVGAENYVLIDRPYDASEWTGSGITRIDLAVQTSNNSGRQQFRIFRAKVVSAESGTGDLVYSPTTKVTVQVDHETIDDLESIAYLPASTHLGGMATVYRDVDVSEIEVSQGASVEVSSAEAHTGEKSLKIVGTHVGFVHGKLELRPGKRYVLSYWVKRDNSNVFDYNVENNVAVYIAGETNNLIIASETKAGRLIEGWQRIEVEFEIDPALHDENKAIETRFMPTGTPLYIDDIRISPKTGGIMTYVYNPQNFRLVATLNANNYATFYYYDEQGNLYLTKQETEEGIVTVSGGHSHTRSTITP